MTNRSSHRIPKTAAELMEALQKDPDYQARIALKNRDRMQATADAQSSARLVLNDLRKIGIDVASLDELRTGGQEYEAEIPLLVLWLGKIDDDRVKAPSSICRMWLSQGIVVIPKSVSAFDRPQFSANVR